MTHDPYAILGIPRNASDQQVRRAYRRLAKRYHPDLHPDGRTSREMRRVNGAWEILSSPEGRARYDANSAASRSPRFEHWSTPGSRSASASPQPQSWNTARGSPPTARTYRSTTGMPNDNTRPGWLAAVGAVATGLLVLVALFSGILPAPLFGIALLVAARGIFARFE